MAEAVAASPFPEVVELHRGTLYVQSRRTKAMKWRD